MQLRTFHIRLTKEHLTTDQEMLNSFMQSISVHKTCEELINGQPNYWSILIFYEFLDQQTQNQRSSEITEDTIKNLTPEEKNMYELLKQWRRQKAEELSMPSFIICHNFELLMLVKAKPRSIEELFKIKGFGTRKVTSYGEELIKILRSSNQKT